MAQRDGCQFHSFRRNTTTPHILRTVSPGFTERQRSVPKLGDIWIPKSPALPNLFHRFYIHGVEDLFQTGDRVVKVEHIGSRSRLISRRVWRDLETKWQFQQEATDEQCFSIFPSSFECLRLVAEGAQSKFDV
jgi:hypothetical protein